MNENNFRNGFDTASFVLSGLAVRSYKSILNKIKLLGFNTVRISFCGQMFNVSKPLNGSINFNLNPDLVGLTPLQCMDQIVKYCGAIGIRIILSRKSNKAGGEWSETLWYIPLDKYYTETRFLSEWQMLATRYAGKCLK